MNSQTMNTKTQIINLLESSNFFTVKRPDNTALGRAVYYADKASAASQASN